MSFDTEMASLMRGFQNELHIGNGKSSDHKDVKHVQRPTAAPVVKKRSNKQVVEDMLSVDNSFRTVGVTGDLFTLDDLAPFKSWVLGPDHGNDNTVPLFTLVHGDAPPIKERLQSVRQFEKSFLNQLPMLEGVLSKRGRGFVLAGGAPSQLLVTNPHSRVDWSKSDVDLFLVGVGSHVAQDLINKLAEQLDYFWSNVYGRQEDHHFSAMQVFRTERCISFKCRYNPDEPVIQVILRLYSTVSEVLHGFDLGSACVAYDGENLWFSSRGKLAFEHGVNVVDLSLRRNTFEKRLIKYAQRGFAVVMPDFVPPPISEIKHDLDRGDDKWFSFNLPFLCIKGYRARAADPLTDQFFAVFQMYPANTLDPVTEYGSIAYDQPELLALNNMRAARRSSKTLAAAGLCAVADWTPDLNLFEFPVQLDDLPRALKSLCSTRCFNVDRLKAILGDFAGTYVAKKIVAGEHVDFSQICGSMIDVLMKNNQLDLPFRFTVVGQDGNTSIIGGQFPVRTITPPEWYGAFTVSPIKPTCLAKTATVQSVQDSIANLRQASSAAISKPHSK